MKTEITNTLFNSHQKKLINTQNLKLSFQRTVGFGLYPLATRDGGTIVLARRGRHGRKQDDPKEGHARHEADAEVGRHHRETHDLGGRPHHPARLEELFMPDVPEVPP